MTTRNIRPEFDRLEDENRHTEAAIFVARQLKGELGSAYVAILSDIRLRAELTNFLSDKDARLRDAISVDVIALARCEGIFQ